MPILPREPDSFPEDLLEEHRLGERADGRWWALYTLPRREKELVRRLRGMGIWHYCPLVCRRYQSPAGRRRTVWIPLFPSYVFLLGSEMERYLALTTQCVSRTLEVPDEAELVHDLRQIWRLIQSGLPLTPEARLEPGDRVRIRSGPLVGLEGVVIRRRGEDRLLVAVQFLQKGASIELADFQVERIG
ncbi:MAG: antitermination protein NusG [Thermoguttaceae bacterium]|nr:antitermination protein NusG [Thermoguttaceae bacterium]MDW8036755.1 transcription termination/antitermination NusG family protein [Thermoguttaceae bacterium]